MRKTKQILGLLREYESRNVTFMEADGLWPIVWERARGTQIWDVEGRKYLDLTAAFGVAAAGHANPRVVQAGQKQMAKLLHAMGDVHPHALKAQLARELSKITFERWETGLPSSLAPIGGEGRGEGVPPDQAKIGFNKPASTQSLKSKAGKTIFCNSGFEAVEAALKTVILATGKSGVVAFKGAYHGLGYGALNATHREHFRGPFHKQLGGFAKFVEFPATEKQWLRIAKEIRGLLRSKKIGAVLVEPIQARGGINIPTRTFLPGLRRLCDEYEVILILDEIYTGFGRTGKWFACEHTGTTPDLICLGKALTGGFPLSTCVGRADLMDAAWPESNGEAIHTSTFLGHPVGCAMALAQIKEIRAKSLPARSAQLGKFLLSELKQRISNPRFEISIRGVGLMAGIEICEHSGAPATATSLRIIKELLHRGFILLPEGAHGNVISLTPPLTISRAELTATVKALAKLLNEA